METKSKRFSFAGLTSLTRSFSFSGTSAKPVLAEEPPAVDVESVKRTAEADRRTTEVDRRPLEIDRRKLRDKKSQSLFIRSFRSPTKAGVVKEDKSKTQYDPAEAAQTNSSDVRSSIRRSLSAVVYASPHLNSRHEKDSPRMSGLVPVLVTPGMSDSHGGIVMDDPKQHLVEAEIKLPKRKTMEYDNTLVLMPDNRDTALTIVWQGYGYTINSSAATSLTTHILGSDPWTDRDKTQEALEGRFEGEVWTSYRGLIHPLHLFTPLPNSDASQDKGAWEGLSVTELRQYYDNYGSMMLKIREARMAEQQRYYHDLQLKGHVEDDWMIPEVSQPETNITE
ncbi:hypothetical protein J3Q64DRAFT_1726393 [Phycomyces blakesleeanus]|uniref:Uncharacterized protein n=2 Tax=Phycomyces blakesleeanus TaxID=4837 RepID=A0A162V977_PHYB8|nr:hypothetical protein PHYBLDRAFT_178800 [Phycomyces blakesleeanus NRRL 1555(-)]OAD80942.1 hypothetical protein PHYBLDRAFT_178800 [Phycomyces blakesleeanus NRRL 1555(-)]|eukprot:XP_018298982.1 hypothetical protein PHYBLDRAFT_178800 [Phycomyces blakesleeanus NRRL 1555(-)]